MTKHMNRRLSSTPALPGKLWPISREHVTGSSREKRIPAGSGAEFVRSACSWTVIGYCQGVLLCCPSASVLSSYNCLKSNCISDYRKHNPHTLKDFKPGVVPTTQVSQDSPDDPEEDAQNQDDSVVEADGGCSSHDDNGIDTRRECILKGLCVYLNEDPDKLVKEYKTDDENTAAAMAETVYGIYIIRHSGAEPSDTPEDVGIILEGVTVLSELRNVPFALSILLAFVYTLNLSYPQS
ncbi:uncharacterized protein LOC118471370 [Amphiprion ocellaris]|uniref:uncharacterized protein LOC118471370 n=1 Tax=Amphiprion ocellaris TaxID=80972 RepID=UPI002410B87F|nr:uncharacterized protein LOC118471370 [Amphiprion ocellaris]